MLRMGPSPRLAAPQRPKVLPVWFLYLFLLFNRARLTLFSFYLSISFQKTVDCWSLLGLVD
jgi:hypothetical protein